MVLRDDFTAHSSQWNIYCGERREAVGLGTFPETHDLVHYNKLGKATRPTLGQATSIIDLTFSTPGIQTLDSRIIENE